MRAEQAIALSAREYNGRRWFVNNCWYDCGVLATESQLMGDQMELFLELHNDLPREGPGYLKSKA